MNDKCCGNCSHGYILSIVDRVQCLLSDELVCLNDVCDSWEDRWGE